MKVYEAPGAEPGMSVLSATVGDWNTIATTYRFANRRIRDAIGRAITGKQPSDVIRITLTLDDAKEVLAASR